MTAGSWVFIGMYIAAAAGFGAWHVVLRREIRRVDGESD